MFVGPHPFRLRVPRPESAAALTSRPQSVPTSQRTSQANRALPRCTSFVGSLSMSDVKSGVLRNRTLKVSDDCPAEHQSAGPLGEAVSPYHYPQRCPAARPALCVQYEDRKRNCAHSNNRCMERPWPQYYESEQQLKRLCKQMGSRTQAHESTSGCNLFLSMLEWEVDREYALNSTETCATAAEA